MSYLVLLLANNWGCILPDDVLGQVDLSEGGIQSHIEEVPHSRYGALQQLCAQAECKALDGPCRVHSGEVPCENREQAYQDGEHDLRKRRPLFL